MGGKEASCHTPNTKVAQVELFKCLCTDFIFIFQQLQAEHVEVFVMMGPGHIRGGEW